MIKITNEEMLAALAAGMTKGEISRQYGLTERNVYKRIKALKSAGKLNADGSVPGAIPGLGREISKVSTTLDADGNPLRYNVTEVPLRDGAQHVDPEEVGGRLARLSTLTGADGEVLSQWLIKTFDKNDQDYLLAKMALLEDLPREKPVALRQKLIRHSSLVNTMVLSDTHIGGLSWAAETGADWDLKIAEDMLVRTFQTMIEESPKADRCFLSVLGDWVHYDLPDPLTTLSGNILSSDGRREKMIDVAIRVLRRILTYALSTYAKVTLLVAEGNHDIVSAPWLRRAIAMLYEQEPRLEVLQDPRPFYCWTFGDVFLGWHHGHMKAVGNKKSKAIKGAEELAAIFADEFAPAWGQTTKRYIHTGHLHTKVEVEPRGAQVIQHPTMTARDDHASRHGWGSLRNALCITYHERFGEKARNTVSPEMLTPIEETA